MRTIDDIVRIVALRRIPNPKTDARFITLLQVDDRILKREDIFRDLACSYFGPTFGKYLTGYVFDSYEVVIKSLDKN